MRRQGEPQAGKRPRGVLLLSPPGCGKSQFAKALGNETGRPTVILDIGNLLGSLVGQSESNVRQALKLADAMAPCVLFCDEIEKGLAGASSSGQTDSGVTARVFGSLLTWLNDHESAVFFVGTCNDISKLPPEFARAERFDGVFFVDLPGREQKDGIWGIYQHYNLDPRQPRPGRRAVDRCRDQVVLSARGPARLAVRSGRPDRRPRGRHCGRQDRVAPPVGLRSVPLGG